VHGPLHKVQQLSGRGTDTLLIVNADDDGRDYLEFHFGAGGKYLQDDCRFQMFFIANSDHTFSDQHGQKSVISKLKDYLGVHDLIGSECFQPALAVTKSTLELSPSSGLV
jgi:hypothetical protein